jgi:hypothetical protein
VYLEIPRFYEILFSVGIFRIGPFSEDISITSRDLSWR